MARRSFYAALSTIWDHRHRTWAQDVAESLLERAELAYITALEVAQGRLGAGEYLTCSLTPDLIIATANGHMARRAGCQLEGVPLQDVCSVTNWPAVQRAIARSIERRGSVSFTIHSKLGHDGMAVLYPVFRDGALYCFHSFCYFDVSLSPRQFEIVSDESEVRLIE